MEYLLILVRYRGEVARRLRVLEGLVIMPGVILTWRPRDDVEAIMSRIKDDAVRLMEGGARVEFSYAIINLSPDQLNQLKPMIRRRLEEECTRMLRRGESLLRRLKSGRNIDLRRYSEDFERIVKIHRVLGVEHSEFRKLVEFYRELRIRYGA